jgi:hypothetical protein
VRKSPKPKLKPSRVAGKRAHPDRRSLPSRHRRKTVRASTWDKKGPLLDHISGAEPTRRAKAKALLDQKQKTLMSGYWNSSQNPLNWDYPAPVSSSPRSGPLEAAPVLRLQSKSVTGIMRAPDEKRMQNTRGFVAAVSGLESGRMTHAAVGRAHNRRSRPAGRLLDSDCC